MRRREPCNHHSPKLAPLRIIAAYSTKQRNNSAFASLTTDTSIVQLRKRLLFFVSPDVGPYPRLMNRPQSNLVGWRRSFAEYTDRRVLMVLLLGFASGLPLLLTYSTLSAWLATAGVHRAAIGAFALVGTPYAFKFLWSPLIDRLPPPLPLGRRRGWGISIQIALIAALLALGSCDPKRHLALMGALALLVAFLSASQDIVIDAWRVEMLPLELQGPGAGMIQTGYRIGALVAGDGALGIAA